MTRHIYAPADLQRQAADAILAMVNAGMSVFRIRQQCGLNGSAERLIRRVADDPATPITAITAERIVAGWDAWRTHPVERVTAAPTGGSAFDQYSDLIDAWNRLGKPRRTARYAICREQGHDWMVVPGTQGRTRVCRQCVSYCQDDDGERRVA